MYIGLMSKERQEALDSVRKERARLERKVASQRKRKGVCECLGQNEARALHDFIPFDCRFDPLFIAEESKFEQFVDSIY